MACSLLDSVYFCVLDCILDFDSQPIAPLIYSILYDSQTVSGTSEDAVSEHFIAALNDAIRSGKLKILQHSKEMDFQEGTNQLLVKDKLLILEESAIENVLIPSMRTADNTCRILKCLKACEYLHATKKNRYPLVVYSHHRSLRPALIALKSDRILDSDVELMIEESRYAEWYSTAPAPEHFIPLTENRIGGVSYQVFDEKRKDNMHFFALGKSGSGKTHCLTERMVSLQKLHRPVIVFDTSESFTEEEILEKLSVGCGETAEKKVQAYIAEHITFHRIEEDGIPVDLLKLGDSGNGEDTIRKIESIVESHNPNMGSKQQAAVHAAISDMIQKGNVDMTSLYEVLTSEQIPYDLADQLADTLSFFVNFKANDRDWGELIEESKDIIIISTKAVRSNGGSGLIDMLLMSLYYYQQAHGEKQLSVFIDEIDTIGKKRDGASGMGGNDEREQTLNQLLTEMDGFEGNTGVIILAATNRPESLDPALTRPGRFDRRVPVELPDLKGREEILKVHAKKVALAPGIDFTTVARMASGASGAELANIVNEAALRAVRAGRKSVTEADLEESIEVVIAGYQKKNSILTDHEKCIVAYHEIGHALVAALQNHSAPVQKITIIPRTSGALGYTMQVDEGNHYLLRKEELENKLATLTGGRAAEEVVFGSVTTGASHDIEQATKLARAMITRYGMSKDFDMVALETVTNQYLGGDSSLACSAQTQREIDQKVVELVKAEPAKAIRNLTDNRAKLDELAKYLYEKETITGEEFMNILNREDESAAPAEEKIKE